MDISNENVKECDVAMDVGPSLCADTVSVPSIVDEILEPCVGMEFESDEDARLFCSAYASRVGFSIRSHVGHYSQQSGILMSRRFICSKQHYYAKKKSRRVYGGKKPWMGCKALVKVKRKESGKWVVHEFHKEHNHDLITPLKDKVGNSEVMNVTSEHARGVRSSGRLKDTQVALKYFEHMQIKDSSFFYVIDVDQEGHFVRAFWADARCRSTYLHFGDVVRFDTTYMKKTYRMPLASFVGVNHHGQYVLFGCALIGDASKASFTWLFNAFLNAMFGHQPVSIISDQDRAIKEAVAEVLPKSCHRFCMSPIYRKFQEKLSLVCVKHTNLLSEFEKCVEESGTIDVFETQWNLLLTKFHLEENNWLQELYEDRQHWVPAYFEPKFFAGMVAAQRSENMIPFFHGYVKTKTSFEEFINQYDNLLASRYNEELRADSQTLNIVSKVQTRSPLEEQAARLYTHEIFKRFQNEIFHCFGYYANETEKNDEISKHTVKQYKDDGMAYTVEFNANETIANCSCKMFENEGILCKHILQVFTAEKVSALPSRYILDRWTRKARNMVVDDEIKHQVQNKGQESYILRYSNLCHKYLMIAERGARSIESYNVAMQALEELSEKVGAVDGSVTDLNTFTFSKQHTF